MDIDFSILEKLQNSSIFKDEFKNLLSDKNLTHNDKLTPLLELLKSELNDIFYKDSNNLCTSIDNYHLKNYDFINITPYNGFDSSNPTNARQNNYAWSMCDFGEYIYVGTGRNLIAAAIPHSVKNIKPPIDFVSKNLDMTAEIWRYKKDGSLPWQRVFKSNVDYTGKACYSGFRVLTTFNPTGVKPCIYAGAISPYGVKILKSTNGIDFYEISTNILGTTRTIKEYNGKLYMAVMRDNFASNDFPSLLYSSKDPDLYGWELETPNGKDGQNPIGSIWTIEEFNNHLYVGTSTPDGFQIWRTIGKYPKKDEWKLIVDKGAGDAANDAALTLQSFGDYLYVGTANNTLNPLFYVIPKGADLIRIDKSDNWELVIGGPAFTPTTPSTGSRKAPISGFLSGFNNPYNYYIWQMKVYNDKLYVATYDSSIALEPYSELFIKNYELLCDILSTELTNLSIILLKLQLNILSNLKDFLGCDLWVSSDGITFNPISLNGFGNVYNYGVRNMLVTRENVLYIGTANPFQGCEVYKVRNPHKNNSIDSSKEIFNTSHFDVI